VVQGVVIGGTQVKVVVGFLLVDVVDGSETFLVERGFREVVVVSWEGEIRIVGGVSDLGETVVYRIS
jgi:hypothetical protein